MPTADEVVVFLTARTRSYQQQMAAAALTADKLQASLKQLQAEAAKKIPVNVRVNASGVKQQTRAIARSFDDLRQSASKPIGISASGGGTGLAKEAQELAASFTAVGAAAETTTKDVSGLFTAFSRDVPNPVAGLGQSLTGVAKSVAAVKVELNGLRASASPLPVIASKFTTNVQSAAAATQNLELEINELRASAAAPIATPTTGAFAPVGRSLGKVNDQVTNVQANVGNLSAQFNDIGVTAAAGMSPMLIALQQGTQLSQAFAGQTARQSIRGLGAAFASVISPVSLLTIGVVAGGAALIQWGVSALTAEDGASKLETTLKALEGTMSELKTVRDQLASGNLAEQYGDQADAAARLLKTRRELLEVTASLQLSSAFESAGGNIGGLNEQIDQVNKLEKQITDLTEKYGASSDRVKVTIEGINTTINAVNRDIDSGLTDIISLFGVTGDEARKIAVAMGDIRNANGLEEQAAAALDLISYLDRATNGFVGMTAEGRKIVETLQDSTEQAQQFLSVDIASGVASAASAAGRLAENLAAGIENARNLISGLRDDLQSLQLENQFFGQPLDLALAQTRAQFNEQNPVQPGMSQQALQSRLVQLDEALALTRQRYDVTRQIAEKEREAAEAARSSRGGGGGGAVRAGPTEEELAALREQEAIQQRIVRQVEEYLRARQQSANEARQILESLMTPAERFAQKMAEIRSNPILTEAQKAQAIEDLKAIQPAAMQLSSTLSSAFKGLFDNLDEGLKGISDTLKDLGVQLLKMALFKQLASSFPGAFGSGGAVPLVPSANGNVVSGPGISAHSNSVVSKPTIFPFARGAGLMGEAGPEAILPLTRVNGKLGVRTDGQGSSNAIFQLIDKRGAGAPPIDVTRSRGPNGQEMIRAVVSEDIARGRFDKPMQGRYGQTPQKVIR